MSTNNTEMGIQFFVSVRLRGRNLAKPSVLSTTSVNVHTSDCTNNITKFMLKLSRLTTNLFVTVIRIEDAQYDKMEMGPELATCDHAPASTFKSDISNGYSSGI